MKKNLFKRGMAGLLSLVMCLTALVGIGTTTAYAAGERAEVYLDPDTLPDTEVSETTYELLSDEDFNSETNNNTTKLRR